MPSIRPTGVSCSGFIYPDKKNTFEKLKEFLFDSTSGRTDVVFLGSSASTFEPNMHTHTTNPDTYHYTGGLIDGFAKALIQGSPTRTGRSMYATGVQFAYTCNKIPNFDRWNSNTWFNGNTTGVGGYLAGCSTVYDSYYYYKPTTGTATSLNSNTGLLQISLDSDDVTTYDQLIPSEGVLTPLSLTHLWAYSFYDVGDAPSNATPATTKRLYNNSACLFSGGTIGNSRRDNILSTTVPFNSTFTVTPEQPQRYWDRENSWYTTGNTIGFTIGIGYIENDVITELFTDAVTYGYTSGLSVGQTLAQAQAVYSASTILKVKLSQSSTICEFLPGQTRTGSIPGFYSWMPQVNADTPLYQACSTAFGNKEILVRLLSANDIITIRSLNIAANNSAITSYGAWKAVDGFRVGNYVVFRSPWANPITSDPVDSAGATTLVNNAVLRKFGLAASADLTVSDSQRGLPYLFEWGNRTTYLVQNSYDFYDFGINRTVNLTEGPSNSAQLLGFPRSLSTIAPCGFFRLAASDTAKIASGTNTKFKERGIIIKPNLGKFFSVVTEIDGAKVAVTTTLNNAQKNSKLGIFKSANFKYCVTSYTINKYAGDAISTNQILSLTAFTKNTAAGAETQRAAQVFTIPNPVVSNTITRSVQKVRSELNIDLSTINTNWTLHEIKLGFLGKGQATNTNGDMIITTHYGIDTANQHGIAFSKLSNSPGFRTGDQAYGDDAGRVAGLRSMYYNEFFNDIYIRQTDTTLGAISGISPKLVIMFEVGIWEMANPNNSYNGWNTWQYLTDEIQLTGTQTTGNINPSFGFDCLTHIINCALFAGFKRENIIVCFYTPTMLTKVDTPSFGTIDGISYNSAIDEQNLITTKNNRQTFTRASEIFSNTFLRSCGYYNPCAPAPTLQVPNPAAKNSCYVNLGQIPGLVTTLNNIDLQEASWYDSTDDVLNYKNYSEGGALAIGSIVMDYLATAVVPTFFIPPWIPPFSTMLNYTTDPVNGVDLNLCSVSLDRVDIEPYLAALDVLCDQNNIQAKRTLSKFKTKILQ